MNRCLYRGLVWLHPPAFRKQFAVEMLWIFDEAAETEGVGPFFADGLVSLARQWLIREGAWKVAVAAIGGLLHISLVLGALSTVLHK
jgi:hypothetical protein